MMILRLSKVLVLVAATSLVAGCRLAVILVEGGEVQSIGSGTCVTSPTIPQTGAVCIHEVADTSYSETFTAVPATGWDFVKWNTGGGFLCADSTNPICVVTNIPLTGNAAVEAIVASDATYYIMPIFTPAVVEYLVQADSLLFFNGLVSELWVLVAPEWHASDVVSLAIEISGNNDGYHEHGYQEVLVSETTILGVDPGNALVSVDWTTDTNLTHSPETYTACVQAIVDGQPFGVVNCTSYGPY